VNLLKLDVEIEPVDHTFYSTKAKKPLWSSIASERGTKLRHWKEALKDFLKKLS